MGTDFPVERKRAAAHRAEQIRLGFQQVSVLYARAVLDEDWRVLSYRSVADWAASEFGPDRFSADRRREIVAMLTKGGFTQRQIEAATGAGHATVVRDQRAILGPGGPPGAAPDTLTPGQQASREREARRAQLRADQAAARQAQDAVTGLTPEQQELQDDLTAALEPIPVPDDSAPPPASDWGWARYDPDVVTGLTPEQQELRDALTAALERARQAQDAVAGQRGAWRAWTSRLVAHVRDSGAPVIVIDDLIRELVLLRHTLD